jgi:dihydroorotase-like cyclic amidohydrolase
MLDSDFKSFVKDGLKSKSINTPFLGKTPQGSVDLVVRDGVILLEW